MSRRRPDLPPGGAAVVTGLAVLAGVKALGLLAVAEGIATSIAALAAGTDGWRDATVLAAVGAILRAVAAWSAGVLAARGAITAKTRLRAQVSERIAAGGGSDGSVAVLATEGLDALDDYYGSVLGAGAQAAVIPVVIAVRILSADWLSAVVIGLTVPLVPLFMVLIGMHTRERVTHAGQALDRLSDHLAELARGLPVLVGLGRAGEQARALERIQSGYREHTRATLRVAFLSSLALELIATLSVAVVAVLLGVRLLAGDLPLSVALLVLLLAPDCFGPLREVGAAFHASLTGREALDRVRGFLAEREEPPASRTGEVAAVESLSVRYPGRSVPALHSVSAVFPVGTVTAVTGASGRGKSTLAAALTGTLPRGAHLSGTMSGIDPSGIAYAPQSPRLFSGTVRDEFLLAAPRPQADAMISELALEHIADADATQLSPGELRRAAVGRALLRVDGGARLLVADEPTAQLDAVAARQVRDAILRRRARVAVVLISHDRAMSTAADRAVALGGGTASPGEIPARPTASDEPTRDPRAASHRRRPAEGRPMRLLAGLIGADGPRWLIAVAWGVAAVGLGLALTAISGWLIVRAGAQVPIMYLTVAIVGVRFFGLGRSVARYLERLATHTAVLDLVDRLRLRLWGAIARRGAASRDLAEGGSALDYLITMTSDLRDSLPRILPLIVGAPAAAGVVGTVAIVAPPLAALAGGAVAAAFLLATGVAAVRELRHGPRRVAIRSELIRRTVSLGVSSDDLRGNGMVAEALGVLGRTDATRATLERSAARTAGLTTAIALLGSGLAAAGAPVVAAGTAVPPEIAAVAVLLLLAVGDTIAAAAGAAQRVPGVAALLTRLAGLAETPGAEGERAGRRGRQQFRGEVRDLRLDGVSARWPGSPELVFAPVTAEVAARQWIGIHGTSGSGKSTLLTVLMGALPTAFGVLSAGNQPISGLDPESWARRIAWCPQDAHVFDSTIRGNLALARRGDRPASDAEMLEVLRRTGLGALVSAMEAGLDGRVGSEGRALSGGERQRLAVARALLEDADILLLDEPTAHLDEPTARAMMDDLRRATGDRIVVLVSHRDADHRPGDLAVHLQGAIVAPAAGEPALVA